MKSLSEQMVSIDRENFARIARGIPELPDAQDTPAEQTAEIFNALFSALRAAFPASVHSFSDQSEFDELRRQWALAFRELARGGFTHHSAARRAATAGASVCAWSL